ncbi:hypothetical protein [Caulobacter segnis]
MDALLVAIAAAPPSSQKGFEVSSLSVEALANASEVELSLRKIVSDPVGQSLRLGLEALAERLFELGGDAAMANALEDVVARDPANEDWRTNLLDKRFNGIGHWMA